MGSDHGHSTITRATPTHQPQQQQVQSTSPNPGPAPKSPRRFHTKAVESMACIAHFCEAIFEPRHLCNVSTSAALCQCCSIWHHKSSWPSHQTNPTYQIYSYLSKWCQETLQNDSCCKMPISQKDKAYLS